MLEQLFGSKTRVRILRLFFNDPEKAYYVRELTRRLGSQINAVRTELIKLAEVELVVETEDPGPTAPDKSEQDVEADGSAGSAGENPEDDAPLATVRHRRASRQKKYFRLNTDSLLYPELKALFLKARVLLEKNFVRRLTSAGNISLLVLTGIFTGQEEAPTDILVVGRIQREKLAAMIRVFEKEIGKEINYTVMTPQEYRYRKDMTDRFLYSILEAKKLTVIDTLTEAAARQMQT